MLARDHVGLQEKGAYPPQHPAKPDHQEDAEAGFSIRFVAPSWVRRFCLPKFSIDPAMVERDLGGPYNPLLSRSCNLGASQSARYLNTADTACCLDLIREASSPSLSRKARTWLTFGMNVLSSYLLASAIRMFFFSSSIDTREFTTATASGFALGFLGRMTEPSSSLEADLPAWAGARSFSTLRITSYPQSSTRVDRSFRKVFVCTIIPPSAIDSTSS